jgi:crotonobetainyl-CoA:carnitine CoA-transferase CaiB-like acyl-CoA transferase
MPLSRVRVLDLSRILAAPFASQVLGDLGAEVIKVERPVAGDDSRSFGPPFLQDEDGRDTRESSFYLAVNRNKKSISVDMSRPEGQDLLRELARHSDVVLENFKVGDLRRYRLDYESLREINPRLVYCSLTGFGQTGPYSSRPGYDTLFQAMSGLMSVTGNPAGTPGGGPMKTGPSLADIMTGQVAVSAILAALYHRDANGGVGQHIDVALLDAMIAANSHYTSQYLVAGQVPVRRGTEGNGGMPSRLFECADGDIVVVAGNDAQYARLCQALGRPELAEDARFVSNVARVTHRRQLAEVFEPLFKARRVEDILADLERVGVPAGPVYDMRQVFEDPQVIARGMAVEIDHPQAKGGRINIAAHPVKYSATPVTQYRAPPRLGEHTDEVLRSVLGLDEVTIEALRQKKVV